MENNKVNVMDLFLVLFVGLKITNQIDWSWWWVFSPIWIQLVVGILLAVIITIGEKK